MSVLRRSVSARLATCILLAVMSAGLGPISAEAAPRSTRAPAAGTTVRGTVSGDHAWDPVHKRQFAAVPAVTVDQTKNLTDQVVHVGWRNFTPSSNGAGSFFSAGNTYYAVTVLECRGTNPAHPKLWKWPDFGPDCYNFTAADANAAHGVGNQAYTLTGRNGDGESYFHVETSVENDFLRCSATQPCSIVVVPNWGGVQNPGARPGSTGVDCADHSGDVGLVFGNYALDTSIGEACSWADRIVVPLSFAPTPQNCPLRKFSFAAEGAPVLARTFQQWRSAWCLGGSGLSFDFDSGVNEQLARQAFLTGSGALTSSIDVAVVNEPATPGLGGRQRKFTYAPIANSAVVVAYHIDNERTGKLITHLTLNARLVAKLITQSYSLAFDCAQTKNTSKQGPTCDPAVHGNPVDIFDDPEFHKLNPQYPRSDFPPVSNLNRGQFLPIVVAGDSDLVAQLTAWVHSDPAARSFLDGKPDPWGMHVNRYYKRAPMPQTSFQVLDPGYTAPKSNGVPGQSTMQVTWNPITGLDSVASSLVIDRPSGIDPTLPPCGSNTGVPCVYQRFGPQAPGRRALFAIVGSVDAAADRFPTARLINHGGGAVAPTAPTMRSALQHMRTHHDGVTQSTDLNTSNKSAYPLTTVDYAMVPTCGITAKKAAAISDFLRLVTRSQRSGFDPGELALGNVALTTAQRAKTIAAAHTIGSASCRTAHSTQHPTSRPVPPPQTEPAPIVAPPTPVSNPQPLPPTPGTHPRGTPSARPAKATAAKTTAPKGPASLSPSPAAFGYKHGDRSVDTAWVLPVLLVLILAVLVGGPAVVALRGSDSGQRAVARVRRLVRR
ncbi:MAG TPA: hypothetical protein VGH43_03305 [Jatrophihabitans sp.]|jgi:hypothetical protein